MTDSFEEIHMLLTTDEDSEITREDHDELIEFLQDEWEPTGNYEAQLFEEKQDE